MTASRRPDRLDLAVALWLLCYVPVYAHAYGVWHFLQLCNLGVLLTCVGLFARNRCLLGAQALMAVPIGLLWCVDIAARLTTGRFFHGGTAYLWDDAIPWPARLLSLYHAGLPVLLLAILRRRGYDRRAFVVQSTITAVVYLVSWWWLRDVENLNYMLHWPSGRVLFQPPAMHALATWALLCALLLWPMHRVFLYAFRTPKIASIHADDR